MPKTAISIIAEVFASVSNGVAYRHRMSVPPMQDPLNMTYGATRGRIKVFCRPRCFDEQQLLERGGTSIECSGAEHDEISVSDDRGRATTFGFDRVFTPAATNANIFEDVGRPLVTSVLCGYNSTLMAYGQTGSGKTHSLSSGDGLINQMLGHLYRSIDMEEASELYRVSLSYAQVYNEKCYDLLHPSSSEKALPLRENKEGGVYLEGVSEHRATSLPEVLDLLAFGRKRLHFAETKMNRHSSRSHAVCVVKVERTVGPAMASGAKAADDDDGGVCEAGDTSAIEAAADEAAERATANLALSQALDATAGAEIAVSARLTLVDLAGSERVKRTEASGATFVEAKNINLSLLELGNVIQALSEQPQAAGPPVSAAAAGKHVPFRNSTLTRLLQESLGGNCKTSLLLCVSPGLADASETKGTLQFGSRAMRVRQEAVINARANYEELAQQMARQLEDKEAVWTRKHERLETKLAAATSALQAMEQIHAMEIADRERKAHRALQAAVDAERSSRAASEAALAAELRACERGHATMAEVLGKLRVSEAGALEQVDEAEGRAAAAQSKAEACLAAALAAENAAASASKALDVAEAAKALAEQGAAKDAQSANEARAVADSQAEAMAVLTRISHSTSEERDAAIAREAAVVEAQLEAQLRADVEMAAMRIELRCDEDEHARARHEWEARMSAAIDATHATNHARDGSLEVDTHALLGALNDADTSLVCASMRGRALDRWRHAGVATLSDVGRSARRRAATNAMIDAKRFRAEVASAAERGSDEAHRELSASLECERRVHAAAQGEANAKTAVLLAQLHALQTKGAAMAITSKLAHASIALAEAAACTPTREVSNAAARWASAATVACQVDDAMRTAGEEKKRRTRPRWLAGFGGCCGAAAASRDARRVAPDDWY